MIGAIIGDIVGSRFEFHNTKYQNFELFHSSSRFTDDTVMTLAVAEAILRWDQEGRTSYERLSFLAEEKMRAWGRAYPFAGYGKQFKHWLFDDSLGPYNSCGNGAAMRISPVGWAATSLEECIAMSRAVTEVTHNHPDGFRGAEATAVQIFLARQGESLAALKKYEQEHYYIIKHDLQWLKEHYHWHSVCDGTCQAAYECLYASNSFEEAIRNCIIVGGDCDTTGAICGGIAQVVWGIPKDIEKKAYSYLDKVQISLIDVFKSRYCNKSGA